MPSSDLEDGELLTSSSSSSPSRSPSPSHSHTSPPKPPKPDRYIPPTQITGPTTDVYRPIPKDTYIPPDSKINTLEHQLATHSKRRRSTSVRIGRRERSAERRSPMGGVGGGSTRAKRERRGSPNQHNRRRRNSEQEYRHSRSRSRGGKASRRGRSRSRSISVYSNNHNSHRPRSRSRSRTRRRGDERRVSRNRHSKSPSHDDRGSRRKSNHRRNRSPSTSFSESPHIHSSTYSSTSSSRSPYRKHKSKHESPSRHRSRYRSTSRRPRSRTRSPIRRIHDGRHDLPLSRRSLSNGRPHSASYLNRLRDPEARDSRIPRPQGRESPPPRQRALCSRDIRVMTIPQQGTPPSARVRTPPRPATPEPPLEIREQNEDSDEEAEKIKQRIERLAALQAQNKDTDNSKDSTDMKNGVHDNGKGTTPISGLTRPTTTESNGTTANGLKLEDTHNTLKSMSDQQKEAYKAADAFRDKLQEDIENEVDMFAPVDVEAVRADLKTAVTEDTTAVTAIPVVKRANADTLDDADGYYRIVQGEIIGNFFHVYAAMGKGVFSSVVRARDTRTDIDVAVKIIRNNSMMYKSGQREITILKRLKELDPDDKRHVIRFFESFEHAGHLCLVFESLHLNLREVLKKFGRNVGLNLRGVKTYSLHLFYSLSLLQKGSIIHADIKPDNILVNKKYGGLKLADLGSATSKDEIEQGTPYLCSRYYRAPEIIIGLSYDHAIDVWAVGCTLFELYTGRTLLQGRTNNEMLRLMMELKGKLPIRMLKKGSFVKDHFDDDGMFNSIEVSGDGKETCKKINVSSKPINDLKTQLLNATAVAKMTEEELKLATSFCDFLERCLDLNPEKRLTIKEALGHQFLISK